MLRIILIGLILGPSQLTCAEGNSSSSNIGGVILEKENSTPTTAKGGKLYTPSTTNVISTTPSLLSSVSTSVVPSSNLPSKSDHLLSANITKIDKLPNELRNSAMENEQFRDTSKKANTVVTEGGNNVTTLDTSGIDIQNVHENSRETIVAEGGVQVSAGDRIVPIVPNATVVPSHNDLDLHSTIMEGISSMNEGKIIARKGVVLDNNTIEDSEEHKTGEIDESNSVKSGSLSHVRKPKPIVTDDNNESLGDKIQKMDYVIPIVCTVFSVPLLIVLAIYLYKRGSDLWERRHYNRMDFLIEGMYNE